MAVINKKFYYCCLRAALMFLFADLNVSLSGYICATATTESSSAKASSSASASETVNVGKLRSSAEVAFSKGEIDQALKLWEQVIEIEPRNENNFFKRYRVYIRQQKLREALADLNSALEINPKNENILVSRGKLHLKMGKCFDAEKDFLLLKGVNPNHKDTALREDAHSCYEAIAESDKAYNHKQWAVARDYINHAMRYAESSPSLLMRRAWCYFFLEDQYESISDTGKVLKMESDNLEALELRGRSYYILGEFDTAMNHYRKGLKFDPEHKGIKDMYRIIKKVQDLQKKAKKASDANDHKKAVELLKKLVELDPNHSTLAPQTLIELAHALKNLKQYVEAKQTVQKVFELDPNSMIAHRTMGQIHMDAEEFDEAVFQFKKANEYAQGDASIEEDIRKAEAAVKQAKQKDYYKILGVARRANLKAIKKAYREKALEWHPDKHKGEEEKEKAEKQFQLVAEAYEILSDTDKRAAYDRGEDVTGNNGGQQQQQGFPQGHPFAQHFRQGGQQFHFQFG